MLKHLDYCNENIVNLISERQFKRTTVLALKGPQFRHQKDHSSNIKKTTVQTSKGPQFRHQKVQSTDIKRTTVLTSKGPQFKHQKEHSSNIETNTVQTLKGSQFRHQRDHSSDIKRTTVQTSKGPQFWHSVQNKQRKRGGAYLRGAWSYRPGSETSTWWPRCQHSPGMVFPGSSDWQRTKFETTSCQRSDESNNCCQ